VSYVRAERYAGETKYPFNKMLRFALDGITSFSYFPLQIATYAGFVIAGIAVLGIIATIILRLTGSQAFYGQATTLVSVLFLGGVQLISLGIIGEYLGRIYDEVKGRPLYIVREALGFESRMEVERAGGFSDDFSAEGGLGTDIPRKPLE
jgi:dolichol-phosphate mannosyltransferase